MTERKMNMIVKAIIGQGYNAERIKTVKGGVEVDGVSIKFDGINIAPVVYFDSFSNDDTSSEIAAKMIEVAEKAKVDSVNVDELFSWESIKHNLMLRIRPHVEDDMLTRPLLDMDTFVSAKISSIDVDGGMATISIKKGHLDYLGVTEDQIFNAAKDDSIPEYVIMGMSEMLFQNMPVSNDEELQALKEIMGTPSFEEEQMYVATNKDKAYGASLIACPQVLQEMAEKINSNLFILPSSIHEVIMVRDDGTMDSRELQSMVGSVNATEVAPTERLSNHVYRYRLGSGKIEIAD